MSGGAVRIRAPVHMDMLRRARTLTAVAPRALPPFCFSRGYAATELTNFRSAATAAAKIIPGGHARDPKHIPGGTRWIPRRKKIQRRRCRSRRPRPRLTTRRTRTRATNHHLRPGVAPAQLLGDARERCRPRREASTYHAGDAVAHRR
jgi:hypothetical protein